jgi:hypothetical protein
LIVPSRNRDAILVAAPRARPRESTVVRVVRDAIPVDESGAPRRARDARAPDRARYAR